MPKSMPADQQSDLVGDEKRTLLKIDMPHQAEAILKAFHRVLNWLSGFMQLTEEEQKEAGIYRGLHRYD